MKNRLYLARDMGGDCSSLGAQPVTVLPRVALRLGSVSHGHSHFCLQHSDDWVSINIRFKGEDKISKQCACGRDIGRGEGGIDSLKQYIIHTLNAILYTITI